MKCVDSLGTRYNLRITSDFFTQTRGTSGDKMEKIVLQNFPGYDPEKLIQELYNEARKIIEASISIKPGVIEILNYFKDNCIKMAIASSSPKMMILKI